MNTKGAKQRFNQRGTWVFDKMCNQNLKGLIKLSVCTCCHGLVCKRNFFCTLSLSLALNPLNSINGPSLLWSTPQAHVRGLAYTDHDPSLSQHQCLDQFLYVCIYSHLNHSLNDFWSNPPTCTKFNIPIKIILSETRSSLIFMFLNFFSPE